MKRSGKLLWLMAGGLPLAAAVWSAGLALGPQGSNEALAQETPAPPATEASDPQPWEPMLTYLHWQELGFRQRQAEVKREPEEWQKLVEFLKDNCPNRWHLLVQQAPLQGSAVRTQLLLRWENIQRMQSTQPAEYQNQIDQFKEEDVLIGLAAQIRAALNRQEYPRARELRRQVQTEAGKLVDLTLQERDMRIATAQAQLNEERESLQRDMGNRDLLAGMRAQRFLRQAGAGRGFNPANRPGFRGPDNNQPSEDTTPPSQATPTAAGIAPAKPSGGK